MGAQAILTMRGWDQSERFDAPWALVDAQPRAEVHVLADVSTSHPGRTVRHNLDPSDALTANVEQCPASGLELSERWRMR
jgi:hypothetical protein